MLGLTLRNRAGLPGVTARAQILCQEDAGPALLHHGFEALGKSFHVSESSFIRCETGIIRGSNKSLEGPSGALRE